jgi:host factor-I protein
VGETNETPVYNQPSITRPALPEDAMDNSRDAVNIQSDFFNRARKDRTRVTIFLNNGKKLVGRIKSFDRFTLILDVGAGEQMIFKHAVATVSTARAFDNRMNLRADSPAKPKVKPAPETKQGSNDDTE